MTPWRTAATRSRPMPVSTHGLGKGVSLPDSSRLNCMKTRFQISTYRPQSQGNARFRAHIVMNLAARSAGAAIAHGPEVFLQARNGENAVSGDILHQPKAFRFFVHT